MADLKTNRDRIIEQSVLGEVSAPRVTPGREWRVGPDGVPRALPGVGGISYNFKVGHSALNWAADHVEPGVSLRAEKENANRALNMLACVGNLATVASGDAKGEGGVVVGKHGGIEHVLVDFPDKTLDKLVIGDKVQIRARGLGLELSELPDVRLMNMDPDLLKALDIKALGDRLRVGVAFCIPGELMGSGIGQSQAFTGDYDIQLFDAQTVDQHGLEGLRVGDIVAVKDHDHTYGRGHRPGAVTVGLVVHSQCVQAGHGPGLTTLMSSPDGAIEPVRSDTANLAECLKIGTARSTS